ncbi:aldo/keto reductase [Candidatus Izimaplasma bacterium]|nr:aldo/keto reductase [Candidatus Izimaplasma bacterium]
MIKVKLNNNTEMPIVGLGTWLSKPEDAYNAVLSALKAGYRHIDTAAIYGNEDMVGKAINDSNIPREEIFLTTKIWNTEQGYEKTKKAVDDSLKRLNQEYVDLILIHWFKGYELATQTYKALEDAYKEGKTKAIGVSNYNVHHIENILNTCDIVPSINQVETHVSLQNQFLFEYCQSKGIQLEGYAPLKSWLIKEVLEDELLNKIASKYSKTVPQVVVRWFVQRGIVVIPKSINPDRIMANYDIWDFELTDDDMKEIKTLNKGRKLFVEMDNVPF